MVTIFANASACTVPCCVEMRVKNNILVIIVWEKIVPNGMVEIKSVVENKFAVRSFL